MTEVFYNMLGFYLAMLDAPEEKNVFEELYKEYKTIMYNNAYGILKDSFLAEDAVHNAFLAIIENSKKVYSMDSNERRNYLLIINRNAAYAIYEKSKKEQKTDNCENSVASSDNIELGFEIKENTDRIFKLLKTLDTKYSDILVLKLFYDMSSDEIAKAIGITSENVRVRIFRGKNQLKNLLKEELEDD